MSAKSVGAVELTDRTGGEFLTVTPRAGWLNGARGSLPWEIKAKKIKRRARSRSKKSKTKPQKLLWRNNPQKFLEKKSARTKGSPHGSQIKPVPTPDAIKMV